MRVALFFSASFCLALPALDRVGYANAYQGRVGSYQASNVLQQSGQSLGRALDATSTANDFQTRAIKRQDSLGNLARSGQMVSTANQALGNALTGQTQAVNAVATSSCAHPPGSVTPCQTGPGHLSNHLSNLANEQSNQVMEANRNLALRESLEKAGIPADQVRDMANVRHPSPLVNSQSKKTTNPPPATTKSTSTKSTSTKSTSGKGTRRFVEEDEEEYEEEDVLEFDDEEDDE